MSRQRVPDGIGRESILGIPAGGPRPQLCDALWRLKRQPVTEEVGEEVVVAIPLPRAVERYDEQVALLQGQQRCSTIGTPSDGIAQGGRQAIEYGGLQQEVLNAGRLTLDDLFHEVVQDIAIAAGERFKQDLHIVAIAQ